MNPSINKSSETAIVNRELYLELLKRAVLATLYEESSWYIMGSRPGVKQSGPKRWFKEAVLKLVHSRGFVLAKPLPLVISPT